MSLGGVFRGITAAIQQVTTTVTTRAKAKDAKPKLVASSTLTDSTELTKELETSSKNHSPTTSRTAPPVAASTQELAKSSPVFSIKEGAEKAGKKETEKVFRKDAKYEAVINKIKVPENATSTKTQESAAIQTYRKLKPNSSSSLEKKTAPLTAEDKCEASLKAAIDALENPGKFSSKREAFLAYKTAMREALGSTHYQSCCGNSQNKNDPLFQLANYLCFREYTEVNIGKTTHELAAIRTGQEPSPPMSKTSSPLATLKAKISRTILDVNHKKAGNQESLGQKIKGELISLKMDPNMNGNPATVKCKIATAGKTVTDIRTATPTDHTQKVNPEFKAFLRHLEATGQRYTMVNLQNRTNPPLWKRAIGGTGELIRSKHLEALTAEFPGVIEVYTLDKNSLFYHQAPSKEALGKALNVLFSAGVVDDATAAALLSKSESKHHSGEVAKELVELSRTGKATIAGTEVTLTPSQKTALTSALTNRKVLVSKQAFANEFKAKLLDPNGAFHIPESRRKDKDFQRKIDERVKFVQDFVFEGKDSLSPEERQDFLEISYLLLTDLYVSSNGTGGADFFNQSCKDCIDRGGGANWLMLAVLVAKEAKCEENTSEELEKKMDALPLKLEEDALWARKRGLMDERLERASNAIDRIITLFEGAGGGEALAELDKLYTFGKADFEMPN